MDQAAKQNRIFNEYPVPKALAAMALPTIASQLVHVVYNIADTWFVGLTGDPAAVAAISMILPLYNTMTCLSNLFGIGAAGMIGRYLGTNDRKAARCTFETSVWSAVITAVIYGWLVFLFGGAFLHFVGSDARSIAYAELYIRVTIVIGSIPTIASAVLAHLLRANGLSSAAGAGLVGGGLLNMVLDPLFMFILLPKGNEVLGAAVATVLSNVISLVYFLWVIHRQQLDTCSVKPGRPEMRQVMQMMRGGLPSFAMTFMPQFSNTILYSLIGAYQSAAATAAIGIVRKIDSVAFSVNQGITQGMLPMLAYDFAARKKARMKQTILLSLVVTFGFSLLCSSISFLFPSLLVGFFMKDAETSAFGSRFLKVLCFAVPCYSVTYVMIAAFQAVNRFKEPLLLSLRRGIPDTLMFYILNGLFGLEYILWSSPIVEAIAMVISAFLFIHVFWNQLLLNDTETSHQQPA